MRFLLLTFVSLAVVSCANTRTAERKPVPPPGSDQEGYIPWNDPSQGPTSGGVLGDMMERR